MIATSIVRQPEPGCMFRRIGETDTYEVAYWREGALYRTSIRLDGDPAGVAEAVHDLQGLRALLHRAPSAFSLQVATA